MTAATNDDDRTTENGTTGGGAGAAHSGTDRLRDEYATLRSDLDALRADLAGLRDAGGEVAADAVAAARARLEVEAERLGERLHALAGDAGSEGRRFLEEAEREVKERPIRALAWSFGAGLLLGWLTRRR